MINYIKDKKYKNIMKTKKFYFGIYVMVILSILSFNVMAQTQHQLLRYQFEEGSGNVILDSSGNNYNGIQNSCSWSGNEMFGTYSIDLDGSNDYISVLQSTDTPDWFFTTFWFDADIGGNEETVWNVKGTTENYLVYIDYSDGLDYLKLDYIDEQLNLQTLTLIEESIDNQWNHYVIGINNIDDKLCVWKNGVHILLVNVTNGFFQDLDTKQLLIGRDFDGNYADLDGRIDEYRIFDFILNESQILNLYNDNVITLVINEEEEPEDNGSTVMGDLIVDYSPKTNDSITLFDDFVVETNILTDCFLYINNVLIETSLDKISHIVPSPELEFGENNYFWYCEHINLNDTTTFEILATQIFNVTKGGAQEVSFIFNGLDFETNDLELWATSPCLEEGYSAIGMDMLKYRPEYNPNGAYFSKVENGIARFNLSPDNHEFCLYNGRFIVNEEGKTNNYDVVTSAHSLELGELNIPNNITTTFFIDLEVFDVYGVENPKAWGQSWTSIIGGLILLLLGVIVLIAGIMANNGKITIAGAFLVMSALGIEFVGFVGLMV